MPNLSGFDANQIEPSDDFEPIPAGKYNAVITDSEMKETKAGNGTYLQLAFQIIDGEYRNRMLWARLNLYNPSETAVKIAQAELSAICRAVGVLAPSDSVELHNLPLVIHVRCKKRSDTGEITNEIKGYSSAQAAPKSLATVAAPVTAGGAGVTPPWKRS